LEEIWREIEDFPSYAVSNYGYVKNIDTNHILRPQDNGHGYLRVDLFFEGYHKKFYVHHLVALSFFGEYRRGMQITWVNGDRSNNATNNLRLMRQDPRHYKPARKTWGKRVRIVETGEIFRTVKDCARAIGADHGTIYKVLRGERSSHLGYSYEFYEE